MFYKWNMNPPLCSIKIRTEKLKNIPKWFGSNLAYEINFISENAANTRHFVWREFIRGILLTPGLWARQTKLFTTKIAAAISLPVPDGKFNSLWSSLSHYLLSLTGFESSHWFAIDLQNMNRHVAQLGSGSHGDTSPLTQCTDCHLGQSFESFDSFLLWQLERDELSKLRFKTCSSGQLENVTEELVKLSWNISLITKPSNSIKRENAPPLEGCLRAV